MDKEWLSSYQEQLTSWLEKSLKDLKLAAS